MALSVPTFVATEDELNKLTNVRLVDILKSHGFDGYNKRTLKTVLVKAVLESVRQDEDEIDVFTKYQVRYVGVHHQQLIHNENSTPTNSYYTFPRGVWVTVKEIDYRRKYDAKIKKAIERDIMPDWEVRRVNPVTNAVKEFYKTALEKLRLIKKPRTLTELRNLTEEQVVKLEGYFVRTIKELVSMPQEWISATLGIDQVHTINLVDEAKEALR